MTAGLVGLVIGLVNGGICHYALWRTMKSTDKVFYTVWAIGFFERMLVFGLGFWYVMKHPEIPMVPAMLGLVAGQFAVGVIPLKRAKKSKG